jgi:hypothetical protein
VHHRIFDKQSIYVCCAFTLQELYDTHIYIYIYIPMSPTSVGSSSALLRFIGSVGNLPLLTTGDYYYHESHNKNGGKENSDWAGIWYGYWWV